MMPRDIGVWRNAGTFHLRIDNEVFLFDDAEFDILTWLVNKTRFGSTQATGADYVRMREEQPTLMELVTQRKPPMVRRI